MSLLEEDPKAPSEIEQLRQNLKDFTDEKTILAATGIKAGSVGTEAKQVAGRIARALKIITGV